MNVVIFSGGSGSKSLQQGLKRINPNIHITNIINAYDDGKSTGLVREIFEGGILGPSDIRKNILIHYKNQYVKHNKNVLDFFELREDLPTNIVALREYLHIKVCDLDSNVFGDSQCYMSLIEIFLSYYTKYFKLNPDVDLSDFNFSNIIFGSSFFKYGIDKTIAHFERILELEDNVVVHSAVVGNLTAITNDGVHLMDEATICNHQDVADPIRSIDFCNDDNYIGFSKLPISQMVLDAISNADLILVSPGTIWSSIIPTLQNNKIQHLLRRSEAKKFIIVNTDTDGDTREYTASDYINKFSDFFDQFTFIFNSDSDLEISDQIIIDSPDLKIYEYPMGIGSTHDPYKLASTVLHLFFDDKLRDVTDIVTDFDGTCYFKGLRDSSINHDNLSELSLAADLFGVSIISGNSYHYLRKVTNLYSLTNKINIVSDGGFVVRDKLGNVLNDIHRFIIPTEIVETIRKILYNFKADNDINFLLDLRGSYSSITNISVTNIESTSHVSTDVCRINLRNYLQKKCNSLNLKIAARGRASLDICIADASKKDILSYIFKDSFYTSTVYFGDEIYEGGNDFEIAESIGNYIDCSKKYIFNTAIKLLRLERVKGYSGIILAAGQEQRNSSECPKALFNFKSEPMILSNIKSMLNYVSHIYIAVSKYDSDKYKEVLDLYNLSSFVTLYPLAPGGGCGHTLSRVLEKYGSRLQEDLIMIWGDSIQLSSDRYLSLIRKRSAKTCNALVPVTKVNDPYVDFKLTPAGNINSVLFSKFNEVCRKTGYQDLSIFYFNKFFITDKLKKISTRTNYEKIFLDVFNLSNEDTTYAIICKDKIRSFNTFEEYLEVIKETKFYG